MSIERFLLVNLLMDFCIVSAATRALGCFRFRRTMVVSALATLLGLWTAAHHGPLPPLPRWLAVLPLAALASGGGPLRWPGAALGLVGTALTSGAAARVALPCSIPGAMLAGAGGAVLACGNLRMGRAAACRRQVHLRIVHQGQAVHLNALVDTGNRLREPFSGLPVIIADERALAEIAPRIGLRRVAYGSVGTSGTLACFHPDRIYLSDGSQTRRAPDAWVALYPGRLPGGLSALAPPELCLSL